MNANKFWNMLTESNKAKVEEVLQNYAGSEGIVGRVFELYEEGADAIGLTAEEYLNEISPNEYVDVLYEKSTYKEYLEEY